MLSRRFQEKGRRQWDAALGIGRVGFHVKPYIMPVTVLIGKVSLVVETYYIKSTMLLEAED